MSQARASLASLTGLAYVVLLVASLFAMGITPSVQDSTDEIVSFYADKDTNVLIGSVLFGLAAVAFLFFIGSFRSMLGSDEGSTGSLSAVAFGGGIVAAAGMLIFAGLGVTLADGADNLEPSAMQAINALNVHMYLPLAGGIVTFLVATGLVGIRTKVLPRWLAWAAIVIAILVFTPVGFFAFLGSIPWVLVTSIVLLRGRPGGAATD